MAIYGYARVSSVGQSLEVQREKLRDFGCEIVREEKVSAKSREGRDELATLLEFLREGDTLVVTKVDRLARSIRDLSNIVAELEDKGITLKVIDQPVDTSNAIGKCFLDMLGVFAEMENSLRAERQRDGIAKAKERGVYRGRKQSIDYERVLKLLGEGKGATAIAKEMKISRSSVYKIMSAEANCTRETT